MYELINNALYRANLFRFDTGFTILYSYYFFRNTTRFTTRFNHGTDFNAAIFHLQLTILTCISIAIKRSRLVTRR